MATPCISYECIYEFKTLFFHIFDRQFHQFVPNLLPLILLSYSKGYHINNLPFFCQWFLDRMVDSRHYLSINSRDDLLKIVVEILPCKLAEKGVILDEKSSCNLPTLNINYSNRQIIPTALFNNRPNKYQIPSRNLFIHFWAEGS